MKEGDIVLASLPQADGQRKNRPALFLCQMRPFRDILLCGISTKLHQQVPDFDELLIQGEEGFSQTGLVEDSLIRLGFLTVVPRARVIGTIGAISAARYQRLLNKLIDYLSLQAVASKQKES